MTVNGRCLCGATAFAAPSPSRVHYFHCGMCRRATGSAFAVLAWVPRGEVKWMSGEPTVRRSSPIRHCGTPLFLQYDVSPEVALMLGAFDRPDDWVPTYHYGVEGRLPWIDCGSELRGKATKERF